MVEIAELVKVIDKIIIYAENTNGPKPVTNKWAIDSTIQKKPKHLQLLVKKRQVEMQIQ